MNSLLSIRDLSISVKTPQGWLPAVHNVNIEVPAGKVIGLVGESGCGKSLTAQAILNLFSKEDQQVTGQIFYKGQNLLLKSKKEWEEIRGKQIAMIFQDPAMALNPVLTIGFQVTESLKKHEKLSQEEANLKAIQLLQQTGVTFAQQRLQQYPHELSGGIKQRVVIAIALACNPQLLLADEPTTALDVTIQAQVLDVLKEQQKQRGLSLLFISHDLGVIANVCDYVFVMYAGRIVEQGPVKQILSYPRHPYTQALIQARRGLEEEKKTLFFIPGSPPSLYVPVNGCSFTPRCTQAMKICKLKCPTLEETGENSKSACWLEHRTNGRLL